MSLFRSQAVPTLWPWTLLLVTAFAVWLVLVETVIHPQALSMESTTMLPRLAWRVLPPVLFVAALFSGQWALASAKLNTTDQAQQLQQQQLAVQQAKADESAATAKAQHQFSLEIRSVGMTVDRYRQLAIWQQLDKANNPHTSMLSQDPNDYEWAGETRQHQYEKRATDAFENAVQLWTERWPIPVLVADSLGMGPDRASWMKFGSGTPLHMLTALDSHKGEGSDVLVQQLFKAFDDNPELPAVLVLSADSQQDNFDIRAKDARFVPTQPDAVTAMLFTRTDRVNKYIRPYTVDVPYDINMDNTQYDVIKLWNFYFDQRDVYYRTPKHSDLMPTSYWNQQVKTLISQVDPHGAQSTIPFWNSGKVGFHPTPWIPIRWTKWQLDEEFDRAPIIGHLHRPIEVALTGKSDAAKAAAMGEAWQQALATLPDGSKPQWLFYDTGADGKHVIPFARAMTHEGMPHPLDISDAEHSYNLSERIGNTGAASPFVQLGLAAMRSYEKGGISVTVNLRQPTRASIIMLTPPTQQEKASNKPNPHNPHGPNDPNPFINKVR